MAPAGNAAVNNALNKFDEGYMKMQKHLSYFK